MNFQICPIAIGSPKDFDRILNDDSVKIVVEVMGGLEPAFSLCQGPPGAWKSVVTSNKELVAAKGAGAAGHRPSGII